MSSRLYHLRSPKRWWGLSVVLALASCAVPSAEPEPFPVVEASIPALQAAMERGELTSRQLVTGVPGADRAP